MKLIFLYGPPAVGKLAVARALAKLTGYRLFHNHLTLDLVRSLFDFGEGPFWELVDRYRIELIEAAAKSGVEGVIFTFVYATSDDDRFVKRIVDAVENHGGDVCFIRLQCNRKELLKRVRAPSRRRFRKMARGGDLKALLGRYDLFADVPYARNLVLDNTSISPRRAARLIQAHYRL